MMMIPRNFKQNNMYDFSLHHNKYLKLLAETNKQTKWREIFKEPKKKPPTFLNICVVVSLLGVSYYFYHYCLKKCGLNIKYIYT